MRKWRNRRKGRKRKRRKGEEKEVVIVELEKEGGSRGLWRIGGRECGRKHRKGRKI